GRSPPPPADAADDAGREDGRLRQRLPALGLRQPLDGCQVLPGGSEAPNLRRERGGDVRPAPARVESGGLMGTIAPASPVEDHKDTPPTLGVIDVDLHHHIASWQEVAPYAPQGLRHRIARAGGPPPASPGLHNRRPALRAC